MTTDTSANRMTTPVTLSCHANEDTTFALTFQDDDGDDITLTGKTLKFVVSDRSGNEVASITGSSIDVIGTDATVSVADTDLTTARTDLLWHMWDETDGATVLGWGWLRVGAAVQGS